MEWDAVGAIAELFGAFAVLITVAYLAMQIGQNTRALKTSSLSSLRDVQRLTENNEKYITLLLKHQREEELTAEERALMVERFFTIMRSLEGIWLQQQLGSVSHDQFNQHLDLMRWALTLPAARRMWTQLASTFDPGFRDVVELEALSKDAPTSLMNKALMALGPEWDESKHKQL
jgi:hypothetical protein